jgi:hypothetical protein
MLRFSAYNATGEEIRLVLELEVWGAACHGPRIRRKERRKLGECESIDREELKYGGATKKTR